MKKKQEYLSKKNKATTLQNVITALVMLVSISTPLTLYSGFVGGIVTKLLVKMDYIVEQPGKIKDIRKSKQGENTEQ